MEQGGKMRVSALFGRSLIGVARLAIAAPSGIGVAAAEMRIAVAGPLSVSPMTAQYATFGEELRRGAELAVRDVNESGGINGQKLTLVIADDAGCEPKMAVEVANELARQGIVFVDGHYCSSASMSKARLPLTTSSTISWLTESGLFMIRAHTAKALPTSLGGD